MVFKVDYKTLSQSSALSRWPKAQVREHTGTELHFALHIQVLFLPLLQQEEQSTGEVLIKNMNHQLQARTQKYVYITKRLVLNIMFIFT